MTKYKRKTVKRNWTDLHYLYSEMGLEVTEIAQLKGCDINTVYYWLKKMNIAVHHPKHKVTQGMRWCFVCKQYKSFNNFCRANRDPSGLVDICKKCRGPYQKKCQHDYYLKHREDLLPKHRISAVLSSQRRKNNVGGTEQEHIEPSKE